MSVVGNNRVGIPIVLLHDAEGSVITVETKHGELIRGLLFEAEDQMNLYLKHAVITSPCPNSKDKKKKRKCDQVYIQGTQILFVVLPDMLRHAPMFQRIKGWRKNPSAPPEGANVGQAAAILRKANERRGFTGVGSGRGGGGVGMGRGGGMMGGRGPPPPPYGGRGHYGHR
mmetsp:Transcript_10564/g.13740  ORF Transcript_10564/g.13740 Transcript_10564/m.13740 type:complete len:171 (+) Transcript_10564:132-644(+)|eukprot:CAMPEP_0116059972 /NCGR_PEP_ID=MMETSP0322-20121206/6128_1 /TAXON_ID=163516 /ORGANISM="Leptocylindrus danicus var. apora, Strain B651" /LENGTH=170 /DNA_ID=CAMNT_0003544483 /DNA_START=57 /DNA_END=569 /DNA_ORIENTATION=+